METPFKSVLFINFVRHFYNWILMNYGYARVSTRDQDLTLQLDALQKAGCKKIYEEKVSALAKERPELERLLAILREGDTIIICNLDRLGRSLKDLFDIVEKLKAKNVGLKSLSNSIDTTSPQGRMIFGIFDVLAEFERELIRERTIAGIEAAKLRGRVGGRRPGLNATSRAKAADAGRMYLETDGKTKLSVSEICAHLKIGRGTFYNYLDYLNVPRGKRTLSSKNFAN